MYDRDKLSEIIYGKNGTIKEIYKLMDTLKSVINVDRSKLKRKVPMQVRALYQSSYYFLLSLEQFYFKLVNDNDVYKGMDSITTSYTYFMYELSLVYEFQDMFNSVCNSIGKIRVWFLPRKVMEIKSQLRRLSFVRKIFAHPISIEITKKDIDILYSNRKPDIYFAKHNEESSDTLITFLFKKKSVNDLFLNDQSQASVYMGENYIGNGNQISKQFNDKRASDLKCKLFSHYKKNVSTFYLCFDEKNFGLSFIELIKKSCSILNSIVKKRYIKNK